MATLEELLGGNPPIPPVAQAGLEGLIPQGQPPEMVDPNTITVNGQGVQAPQFAPYEAPIYEERQPDRIEPGVASMEELIPRQGMFGMKGTLRDVLGTIGDAFLVQSGAQPLYANTRRRERLGSAMYGIDINDPSSVQAGIDRLAAQGFTDEATSLRDRYAQVVNQQAELALDRQKAQASTQKAEQQALIDRVKLGSNMINGARSPEEAAIVRAWIQDPTSVDLTQVPTHLLTAAGISPYQAEQLQLSAERNEISQQRANRPPAPRAASNPTNASLAAPLLRKVQQGGTLTAGEEAALKRLGYPSDRGDSKKSSKPRERSGSKKTSSEWGDLKVK